ncbi:peptidoglycan-binding protein [Alkalihalobacillus oceani]|uniref:Peptidoglycan-binding protein n=1 Tax=Halalkalibacter oceani TaxID=1653776 RepID=A0A9X2DRD4_9BACI|nr:peptidoglycan-binding protein [Halalkalibacter oceani]MCM3714325.1 peptidoglycan-binding protein [Halalkalibacter oceani]
MAVHLTIDPEGKQQSSSSPKMKQVMLSSTFATGLFFTSPLITEAALGDQPLQEGMTHPDVKQLQEALKEKGHFTYHTATGYYGTITKEAVASFQRSHGLEVTGQATRSTIDELLSSAGKAAAGSTNSGGVVQQVLRPGTTSEQVKTLQQQLKEAGYFDNDITGYYGRATSAAVRSFQQENQLAVDGIAGPQTLNALQNRNVATIAPVEHKLSASSVQTSSMLRIGSKGQAVKDVQQRLADLGFYKSTADGIFGNSTASAVKHFQQQQGITVDGIVGPQTLRALQSPVSSVSASVVSKEPPSVQPKPPVEKTPPPAQEKEKPVEQPKAPDSALLKFGSEGQAVSDLQTQLKRIGLFNQSVTGYYGTVTEQSVKAFQRQQGLTVDGVAGPKTIEKLNAAAGKSTEPPQEFNALNLVADASELLGTPYVWGGTTVAGFDCSGFISYVFAKNGIQLPRTVAGMWEVGTEVKEPRVGDIVFFETYTKGPSHAGIYIGNGQFTHSGTSTGVAIGSLEAAYWKDRYLGTKRMF